MPDPSFEACHILVKNWILGYLFHKKLPVLAILVPVMIRPSESEFFWGNCDLEAVEAAEVAEAAEVN